MKRHIVCQALVTAWIATASATGSNPYANEVIKYEPGFPEPWMNDPSVVLGEPARFTGIGVFPAVVSVFNPPWSETDIVSISPDGHLVISFDSPVLDDPNHPFGVDLIIFNNTGFEDISYPSGIVGSVFGNDGGIVELSADGINWHMVPDLEADAMFPTQGYRDAGPYDETPGNVPSDFTRPVDPSLTYEDFHGLSYQQVMELYNGSGGGVGVDIAAAGLTEVLFVRVSNPADALSTIEIAGFAKVAPVIKGDLNGDGVVNVSDLLLVLSDWGACPASCPADVNGDGTVDVSDMMEVLANWG